MKNKLHKPIAPSTATRARVCVVHPRYEGKGKPRIRAGAKDCSCSEVYKFRQLRKGKNTVSETRILQITNDISENMDNPATVHELRETVRYWCKRHYDAVAETSALRTDIMVELMDRLADLAAPKKERLTK